MSENADSSCFSYAQSDSDSESNLSDTDASEGRKERSETATDTEAERTPLKLAKASALLSSSSSLSAGVAAGLSPLNLQVIKAPSMTTPTIVTNTATLAYHSTPTSSFAFTPTPGMEALAKSVRLSV